MEDVFKPVKDIVKMVNPNEIVLTGWDISDKNLYESCERAQVYEPDLLEKLKPELSKMKPMKAAFTAKYIASNQADRANNVLVGTNQEVID